jgi:hypothetical protein
MTNKENDMGRISCGVVNPTHAVRLHEWGTPAFCEPTSQNRDMGHPVLVVGDDGGGGRFASTDGEGVVEEVEGEAEHGAG